MKNFDNFTKQQKFLARDLNLLKNQLLQHGIPLDILGDVCFDIMMMLDEAGLHDEKIVDWNKIFNDIDRQIETKE